MGGFLRRVVNQNRQQAWVHSTDHGQIWLPIEIQVHRGEGKCGGQPRKSGCRPERAIAVAQKHRDAIASRIGCGQVLSSVAIEVTHGDGLRRGTGDVIDGRAERAVAIPYQHRDTV